MLLMTTTIKGGLIFTPTTKLDTDTLLLAPQNMKEGIDQTKQQLDSFTEQKITDCYFNQKGRCAYQKLSYVFVSDFPNTDCSLGCNSFSKIGDQAAADVVEKFSALKINNTNIPIALLVIDILLVTDVPSGACNGLGELSYLMKRFSVDYSIIYSIHGANGKTIDCGGEYLMRYQANSNVYLMFSNVNIHNTIVKGTTFVYNSELYNTSFDSIYDGLVMVNVNSKGSLSIAVWDQKVVKNFFLYNVNIAQLDHVVFQNFGNLIIFNSSVPFHKSDVFSSINSVWLHQSILRVTGYLLFQDVDEFSSYATRIDLVEIPKENLPILRVTFCKLAILTAMTFDRYIGKISLRIEQTAIAALVGVTVSNGVAGIAGSNVHMRNIRNLFVLSTKFENNVADSSSLRLNQVSALVMSNVSFVNNSGAYGAISYSNEEYTYGSLSFFQQCKFIGNRATAAGGGSIYISYTPVMFSLCEFRDNYATIGGAIYSRYGLHVEDCTFSNNRAKYSGGAVFAQDTLSIVATKFLDNSVVSTTVEKCNKDTCKGNGGAIYFDSNLVSAEFELISNVFQRNSAVSGGAVAMRMFTKDPIARFTNNTITKNSALFAGGGIYYSLNLLDVNTQTNSVVGNTAENHGNDISTPIKFVDWGATNSMKKRQTNSELITLYPGQVFSLSPTFTDFVGIQFNTCEESFTTVTSPEHYSLSASSDFKKMFIVASNSSFAPMKIVTKFNFLRTQADLTIDVVGCPRGFSVSQANYGSSSSYICKEDTPTDYIIIVAVCVTIVTIGIALLLLSLCICVGVKVGKKVLYWVQRDKAEKDIEKRLLENEYISLKDETSNHHPHHQQQHHHNDKKNSFVISIDQIFLEKKIGEGGSGVVYLGKWHHNAVAVKCLRIDTTSSGNMDSDEIEKEAALLCKLRHPNIVLFYGISISLHKQYLIVEYLEKGSLEKLINDMRRIDHPTQIPFIQKLQMLTDITCGMVYLHSLKIIHRDLKPANILIDSKGVCKVCDFGLSKIMSNTCHTTTTCVGTLFYIAPEVMKSDNDSDDNNMITTAVDVFSFSIIMWEMFFEDNPYMNAKSYKLHKFNSNQKKNSLNVDPKTPFSVLARVMQGERAHIPFTTEEEKMEWLEEFMPEVKMYPNQKETIALLVSEYLELMRSCWSDDYRARPNFETVLNCLLLIKSQMQDVCAEQKKNTTPYGSNSSSTPKFIELFDMA